MLTRRKRINNENSFRENSCSPPKVIKYTDRRSCSLNSKERCPFSNITDNNLNEDLNKNRTKSHQKPIVVLSNIESNENFKRSSRKLNLIGSPDNIKKENLQRSRNVSLLNSPSKDELHKSSRKTDLVKSSINKLIFNSPRKSNRNLAMVGLTDVNSMKNENLTDLQNTKSPRKSYKIDTMTSPNKISLCVDYAKTPRKSPRKLGTNMVGSPCTLISKLNISTPPKFNSNNTNLNTMESFSKNLLRDYARLKSAFTTSGSKSLVGRETEISSLQHFLSNNLENKLPGSLYVSGAPGTGKTASITSILDDLDHLTYKQVFINCMSKKCAKEIFSEIASQLKIKTDTSGERECIKKIERKLTTSKTPILLILDEIDQLESKDQTILYTIFEWPSLAKSKLVLLGIANMLDLTDRILPRLQANSLCKPDLIHFAPYTMLQIINIIKKRIEEANIQCNIIKPSAINILARKVSAVAGDVRKALDLCRRGIEVCEMDTRRRIRNRSDDEEVQPKILDALVMNSLFDEIYGSKVTEDIKENSNAFPVQQKILLCSLLLVLKNSKTKNLSLGKFHEVYCRVCKNEKLPSMEQTEFYSSCSLLDSRGILQVKKNKELRNSKVSLRLNEDDVKEALNDKILLTNIMQDRSCLTSLILDRDLL